MTTAGYSSTPLPKKLGPNYWWSSGIEGIAEQNDENSQKDMGAIPLRNEDSVVSETVESIEALVRCAQEGDARAFEAVYRQTTDRVYGLCLRMSGDGDRAAELVQDVFVRVWERLGSFRGDALFTTWLHRLTVNVVLQDRRTRARREAREVSTADLERFGHTAKKAMPGTRIDLERAIAALPDKARQVLVLRDVQGYKYDEIAQMTGVTLGTVKAQIHRARRLVKEALG